MLSEKDCEEYIAYGESYQDDPVGNKSYSRYNKYLSEKYAKLNEETNRYESIYLFRPYFIEIEEVTDAEGNISFKEIGERIYPLQTTEPNKANYLDSSIKKSGSNYKFTVQILKDDGFQFRKNYKVGVEGYDRSGNKIMDTGKGYGFRFVSGGAAPTIVVQYPLETLTRVKKGDGILLQGVISTEDGSPVVTVLKQGEDDEKEIEITTWEYEEGEGVENKISGLYDFTYEYRIPETWFSQAKSQQYKIILRATNGKRASEDEKTVLYDVDGPEISLTEVKPVIEKAGKDCINKKFSVKGSINDKFDNVSSAKWELVEKGEGEELGEVIDSGDGLKTTFTFDVDTGDFDNTNAILIITAYDKAGNKSVVKTPYYIDQSTDIPTIEPNDPDTLTFEYKSKAQLVEINNKIQDAELEGRKNFYTGNAQIIMKFTDDDGINTITASATPDGQSQAATTSTVQAKNATEYTYAYKAPES